MTRCYEAGMPKKIAKKDLPATADVAAATSLLDAIAKRKARLEKVRAAAGEGVVKTDPKLRTARKGVKRAQRKLRRELVRVHNQPKKTPAPAPAAAAEAAPAPAEG
jgi:hypothetical protein